MSYASAPPTNQPGPGQMNASQGGAPPPYGGGPPPGQYPPQGQCPPPGAPAQYPPPQPYPQPQPTQPGPGGYYTPQQPIVVQVTPGMTIANQGFGEIPVSVTCPSCHAEVTTTTEYVTGGLAWLICGVLFAAGFFLLIPWCICCIPFCIPSCKDIVHSCPNCKARIGRKNRM